MAKCRGCGRDTHGDSVHVKDVGWMHLTCEVKRLNAAAHEHNCEVIGLNNVISMRDAEIARLRTRIAELEECNKNQARMITRGYRPILSRNPTKGSKHGINN